MNALASRYVPWVDPPAPAVVAPRTCERCKRFQAGDINPTAGMGDCTLKHVPVYPRVDLHCHDWVKA